MKKYAETRIRPHHAGFGMYQVEEYGEAFYKEEILTAIAQQYEEYYILGEDEVPEEVEDIRGKIYGDPEIVIAVNDPYGWEYIGLDEVDKKLSFDDFSSLLMGGPSRYSEKGISYVLIEEDEEEVFYAEWEVPEGESEREVDNEQLREAYEAYMDGESTYRS